MGVYYYDVRDGYINKYLVEVNKEYLKKIRKEIIDNCSIIEFKKYKTVKEPDFLRDEHIMNYKSEKVRKISYNDFFSEDEDEYLVSYNYYNFSVLVGIIDDLLNDNTSSIGLLDSNSLLKSNVDNDVIKSDYDLKEQIKELVDKGLYNEIDELVQSKMADIVLKNQERVMLEKKYLIFIKQAVNLYFRDKIALKDLENINFFFKDIDFENNVSDNLVKVLKKD